MNLMSMKNTKRILVIVGPTAIGKTKLSIELAKDLNTEIISCDSRQFYKELLIGSSPPNPKELSEVKHHFIQNLSVENNFNAGEYEIDAITKIEELHKTKDTIIIVGGSGLYIDAICKGFDKMPKINTELRVQLKQELAEKGLAWVQDAIKKIDPEFYTSCDKQNPQRLLRALEVYKTTGEKFSSYKTQNSKKRPFEIIKIGLTIDRASLYEKINARVDEMLENGLLEEVRALLPFQEKNALQTVGYKEIFSFYNNECTLEQAVTNLKTNTRRFAKRQLTWFRKDESIKWFKPHQINEIKKIISKL